MPARAFFTPLLLAAPAAAQGETGFLRGAGKLDLALSWNVDDYDDFRLGGSPFAPPIDGVERQLYGAYAAWGVRDDLDLTFSGAYVRASADDGPALGYEDEQDWQDAAVHAKWRLHEAGLGRGRLTWLLAPGIRFPLTEYERFADNALNGLGDGDVVLRARTIVQYQWGGLYAALETGYDHRNGRLDDEIPIHLSTGFALGERLTLQPFFTTILALGDTVANPLFEADEDGFTRFGLGAYHRVRDSFGLTAALRRSDEGRNESTGLSLGLVLRF